jgi:hypothetical protein
MYFFLGHTLFKSIKHLLLDESASMFLVVSPRQCTRIEYGGTGNDTGCDPGGMIPLEEFRRGEYLDFLGEVEEFELAELAL